MWSINPGKPLSGDLTNMVFFGARINKNLLLKLLAIEEQKLR